jgi:hypothetical protein
MWDVAFGLGVAAGETAAVGAVIITAFLRCGAFGSAWPPCSR